MLPIEAQTSALMVCLIYLMLHSAIWFALLDNMNTQVRLWTVSGLISGVAVIFLSAQGFVSDFTFYYIAQLLMVIGNLGRMISLRLYLPETLKTSCFIYYIVNLIYYLVFCYLIYAKYSDVNLSIIFYSFYAFICFDYFVIGYHLSKKKSTLGTRLLMISGISFTLSLGIKSLALIFGSSSPNIYALTPDHIVMIIGQFVAITTSNIAFLRIALENIEIKHIQSAQNLAKTQERADAEKKYSSELKKLLTEREELIRQLTLFNQTAGIGALVASLAHELNQPLAAMRLNSELLGTLQSASNDRFIQDISENLITDNKRASNLINSLRKLFTHGGINSTQFNLNELINDVVYICQPKLNQKSIKLSIDSNQSELFLLGDKVQIQQVIINLVNNAIDSFEGINQISPAIIIKTDLVNNTIQLDVTDNGCGITEDMQNQLFNLFKSTKATGMGVGLWLTKTIVESHFGEISVVSNLGNGTTFSVLIPDNLLPNT